MLLAMGLSEVEIRGARNGEWLWSHGGGPMELAAPCFKPFGSRKRGAARI